MPKIKNIIFDLGGVILNIDENAVPYNVGKLGFDAKQLIGNQDVRSLLHDFETGRVDTVAFRGSMKELSGMENLSDEDFDRIWSSILLDFPKERIDYILKLRPKYSVYLLSNTNKLHYDRFSADFMQRFHFPFDTLFVHAFYSFRMGLAKPDLEIFKSVFRSAGIKPEETLFVDDNAENISSAARLGLRTLAIECNSGLGKLTALLSAAV